MLQTNLAKAAMISKVLAQQKIGNQRLMSARPGQLSRRRDWPKAAEDSRTPRRYREATRARISARFWSAAVLCRFFFGTPRTSWVIAAALSTVLAGCATHSSKPASQAPQAQSAATSSRRAPTDILQAAAAQPSQPFEGEGWVSFFDGKSLNGWRETDFAGRGEVERESGLIVLNTGDPMTGINWTSSVPKMNYEVALDAMRVTGSDFFCGLTVPVGDSFCTLIVGGWGGSLVGISSLDGMDASENETTKFLNVEQGRWYRIRLRITQSRIEAWIDKDKFVNVDTTDKRISLRPGEIESSKPFGIASYQTTAALREIRLRRILSPADALKKK